MDLDGDGILDLVSGSWPGEIFFFKGKGKGEFAAPIKLRDKDGKVINPNGGLRKEPDGAIRVTGDATWEKTDKGDVIVYDGERIPVPEGTNSYTTGNASAVHAVDWNGDGKIDLLIGQINGCVYLVPNEGTAKEPRFGKPVELKAGGKVLRVEDGDAGPFAADWDGDGKLDLLVGAGDGSVWFYRNTGTAKEPELAEGIQLVPPGHGWDDISKEPRRGRRAKICAVDWNGDGRLDLLVGDFSMQKTNLPEPSAAEKVEHDKLRKEMEALQTRRTVLIQRLFGKDKLAREEREKVAKELEDVTQKMQAIYSKLPQETEDHGWVWLFLRK